MHENVNNILIRMVLRSDGDRLCRFFAENNRPDITRHFNPFPLTDSSAERIVRCDQRDRYYIAVREDGRIIGFCMLRGWDEGFEVPSFGVFVGFEHQGMGLGRRMTEFAVAEARRLGCGRIRLSVYASNNRAIQLYAGHHS